MPFKDLLTGFGILLGLYGTGRYIFTIFKGQTRPHFFSYLLYGITESTIFAIQIIDHAGVGAYITAYNALACLTVAAIALAIGDRKFNRTDWISLFASILALILWWLTKNPLIAVLLLIVSDAIAFSITFRKTYHKPYSETLMSYFMSWCKAVLSLFALESYLLSNWLFLAYLVTANMTFILTTLIRRKHLKNS
jgi:hypothetical protein